MANKALQLNRASTQYVGRTNFSNVTTNFTMGIWYKPTNFGSTAHVLHNGHTSGQQGYLLYVDTAGIFKLDLQFTAGASSGITLVAGSEYLLALSRAGSGTDWQLWVNGVAVGTPITNNQNPPDTYFTAGASRDSGGTPASPAHGVIDAPKFYTRKLTTQEMLDWYNGVPVSTTSLQLDWELDEGTGSSAGDSSGNSRTGTIVNNPTWVDGLPSVVTRFNMMNTVGM